MNIFVLNENPKLAAQDQCDKHVVKMILESAQLLCSAHHIFPNSDLSHLYKLTHKNHPCSIWTRQSKQNYEWLCSHALALCEEYTFRYKKIHASKKVIDWCSVNEPNIPSIGMLEFVKAMPNEYKTDDTVESYRQYYIKDKLKKIKMVYTNRKIPEWMN
jgi:hypothetical protein